MESRKIIIVGASSGIGAEMARQYLALGHQVALVARNLDAMRAIASEYPAGQSHVFVHDVQQTGQVAALFQEITQKLGGLDVIVYSSGVLPSIRSDEFNTEKDTQAIAVNCTGAVAWLNEAAARFQKLGEGHIVGLSSVAGERGRKPSPVYGSSKAFLSTYLESLYHRLWSKGVAVTCLKPGFIRTPMIEHMGKLPFEIDVETAVRKMLKAIAHRRRVAFIPSVWFWVSLVLRNIPTFIFKRLGF